MKLGENIKRLRKQRGLTQDQFAELFNKMTGSQYGRSTFSNYENGTSQPEAINLPVIAKILGVSLDVIFGLNPDLNLKLNPEAKSQIEKYRYSKTPEVAESQERYAIIKELERLQSEVDRLKSANEALIEAFKAIGEGKSRGGGDVAHKEQKSA